MYKYLNNSGLVFQCVVLDVDEDRQASIHFRVVPKKALTRLAQATVDDEKQIGLFCSL